MHIAHTVDFYTKLHNAIELCNPKIGKVLSVKMKIKSHENVIIFWNIIYLDHSDEKFTNNTKDPSAVAKHRFPRYSNCGEINPYFLLVNHLKSSTPPCTKSSRFSMMLQGCEL